MRAFRSLSEFLRSLARRLLPDVRAMKIGLLALGVGLAFTAALVVAAAIVSVSARRGMNARIAQLETQAARDRLRRVALERDVEDERRRSAERRKEHESDVAAKLQALKDEEGRLRKQLEEARAHATLSAAQLAEVQGRLQETKRQITSLDTERSLAERTIRKYQAAVGFVVGSWSWRDAAGQPVRYVALDAKGEPEHDADGAPLLSPEGAGHAVGSQFVGTGFLVSREGLVLTNRHIAEPWWREREARILSARGYLPHLDDLEVFFPGVEAPFPLTLVAVSRAGDVALVKTDLKGQKLPPVETEPEPDSASPGQPVVILGYPTGLDALLARFDDPVADAIVAKARGDWAKVARDLSRRRMIRPLATQGHLSDVLETQLVYDAATAQGGSGGPVFNARGRVIGLTSAALSDFPGATFGVPIRFGLDLLPQPPRKETSKGAR